MEVKLLIRQITKCNEFYDRPYENALRLWVTLRRQVYYMYEEIKLLFDFVVIKRFYFLKQQRRKNTRQDYYSSPKKKQLPDATLSSQNPGKIACLSKRAP